MIDTDKYEEFENAMNEGRIERVHCLWALAEVKRLREENKEKREVVRNYQQELESLRELNWLLQDKYDILEQLKGFDEILGLIG